MTKNCLEKISEKMPKIIPLHVFLGGGFNPIEKYAPQNWIIFSKFRDEKKKIFELPPPSFLSCQLRPSWCCITFKRSKAILQHRESSRALKVLLQPAFRAPRKPRPSIDVFDKKRRGFFGDRNGTTVFWGQRGRAISPEVSS